MAIQIISYVAILYYMYTYTNTMSSCSVLHYMINIVDIEGHSASYIMLLVLKYAYFKIGLLYNSLYARNLLILHS